MIEDHFYDWLQEQLSYTTTVPAPPFIGHHLDALTPAERSDIASRAWDTRGRTQVGITSQRAGAATKPNRLVFQEMKPFAEALRKLPGVKNATITPGVGVWQDFEPPHAILTEPSWVVSYEGNGDALRLIAETGKKYEQQGVLITRAEGAADGIPAPVVDFEFETPLSLPKQKELIQAMAKHGITGATWSKRNGKTVMRAVAVPQWGMDGEAHLQAATDISAELTARGLKHRHTASRVKVDVLEQTGDHSYDSIINAPS